jgi:hypothetical protein
MFTLIPRFQCIIFTNIQGQAGSKVTTEECEGQPLNNPESKFVREPPQIMLCTCARFWYSTVEQQKECRERGGEITTGVGIPQ